MNTIYNRFLLSLLVCVIAFGFAGCIKDRGGEPLPPDSQTVRIQIKVPGRASTRASSVGDKSINNIQVLSFVENTGVFLYRAVPYQVDTENRWFDIILQKSSLGANSQQRLVVLANLSNEVQALIDGGDLVEGATTLVQLRERLTFDFYHATVEGTKVSPATADFGQARHLPMWGEAASVLVYDEMTMDPIWMLRSLASVTVQLDENLPAGKFKVEDVVVYNTPSKGFAIPDPARTVYDTSAPKFGNLYVDGPTEVLTATSGKAYYFSEAGEPILNTIYIAEKDNHRTGITDAEVSKLVISGYYEGSQKKTWYQVPFKDKDGVLKDVLRNHNYIFKITSVSGPGSENEDDEGAEIEMELTVEPWGSDDVDDMIGDRYLSVSTVKGAINEHNMMRVYFWSNQKQVIVEEKTTDGSKDVENLFYGLTGSNPYNVIYDPAAGQGWVDIMTDRDKIGAGHTGTYELTLNAGGHKRRITVDVNIPSSAFPTHKYVGAFWRVPQEGERLITMKNTGPWSAKVVYSDEPGTETGWVVLAHGKSLDQLVWTDSEPRDAELYRVEGDLEELTGRTGNIYFRIGIADVFDQKFGDLILYAKVVVTDGQGNEHDIYLRIGERADFLMRKTDNNEADNLHTITNGTLQQPRPEAVRWQPFNMTTQDYNRGATDNFFQILSIISSLPGNAYRSETNYPSQAGAFFKFKGPAGEERRAYHPVNTGLNIVNTYASGAWTEEHEVCQTHYRRVKDGGTAGPIAGSEMRQSLFLNPKTSANNSIDNMIWGYYADGYFDRHEIVASTAVNPTLSTVAYVGGLIFNPYNFASLFFPAAGYRDENFLSETASEVRVWSQQHGSVGAQALGVRMSETFSGGLNSFRRQANSVRCVWDDK